MDSVINATMGFKCTVVETFDEDDFPAGSDRSVTLSAFNATKTLNADSTPPGTMVYAKKLSGNQNLDFTALVKDLGGTIDCSGLKLQGILLNNLSSANAVTWADGGANPYSVNGGANKVVPAGGKWQEFFNDKLDDVAAGAKAVAITATDSYELILVFG